MHHNCSQRGATLLEVLIAMLVISVGLLGMAALQLKSVAVNQGAYQRLQAVNLAYEIADSIAINAAQANNGDYVLALADDEPQVAVAGSVANIDLRRWITAVATSLPDGDLIITAPTVILGMAAASSAREHSITICWYDRNEQVAANNACGNQRALFTFRASSRT